MATFFGEVLPVLSRATDDDYDDDEDDADYMPSTTVVRWSPEARELIDKGELKCNVLIIAIGPAATGFLHTYLVAGRKCETLGVLCTGMAETDVNTISQSSLTDKTCYIHRLHDHPDALFVKCNITVLAEQAYSWTEQLMSALNLQNTYVSVLTSSLVSNYRSELSPEDIQPPFLRALKTEQFRGTPTCPYLEQPNTVDGLPAQILTACQIRKLAAILYICYTDVLALDSETIHTFNKILDTTPIRDLVVENPKAAEELSQLIKLHTERSSLYL